MFSTVLPVYKGFEIETLIYACKGIHGEPVRRGQGYDISVRIYRVGADPSPVNSRVFKLSGVPPFNAIGEARRAGHEYGQRVIDGDIADQTVADL